MKMHEYDVVKEIGGLKVSKDVASVVTKEIL